MTVPSNQWTHVAFSGGTNGTVKFYVNGQPAGVHTNLPTDLAGYAFDSVQLGGRRSFDGAGAPSIPFGLFVGSMDESRLWFSDRTENEMFLNYATAVDAVANPDLIWRFDYDPNRLDGSDQFPADVTDVFFAEGTSPGQVDFDLAPSANVPLQRNGRAYPNRNPRVYVQNDVNLPGYNPNEEHALMVGPIAYALRSDLNKTNDAADATSYPFTLVEFTPEGSAWQRALDVYQIVVTNQDYPRFVQNIEAGRLIQPPAPLRSGPAG
jgi:hypothetical protein